MLIALSIVGSIALGFLLGYITFGAYCNTEHANSLHAQAVRAVSAWEATVKDAQAKVKGTQTDWYTEKANASSYTIEMLKLQNALNSRMREL